MVLSQRKYKENRPLSLYSRLFLIFLSSLSLDLKFLNSPSFQYISKVFIKLFKTPLEVYSNTFKFHSRPFYCAGLYRFDDSIYAVLIPVFIFKNSTLNYP